VNLYVNNDWLRAHLADFYPYCAKTLMNERGAVLPIDKALWPPKENLEPLYLLTWNSTFFSNDAENVEACWLLVFRDKTTGHYGCYEYLPSGYSSYTYEPEETMTIVQTTSHDRFRELALTDEQRAHAPGIIE
jgi:hypothetical protein